MNALHMLAYFIFKTTLCDSIFTVVNILPQLRKFREWGVKLLAPGHPASKQEWQDEGKSKQSDSRDLSLNHYPILSSKIRNTQSHLTSDRTGIVHLCSTVWVKISCPDPETEWQQPWIGSANEEVSAGFKGCRDETGAQLSGQQVSTGTQGGGSQAPEQDASTARYNDG